jgi:peptidoglycan-associated lipoprotein
MKLLKASNLLLLTLVLTIAASGCKKKPGYVTKLPNSSAQTGDTASATTGGKINDGSTGGDVTSSSGLPSNPANSHQGWNEDASTFKADTVYFTFDSSVLNADEKSKVSAVADYLKNNSSAAVRVEGNCDERGTAEYNRALGDRRAQVVREALNGMGIDPSRVDTISYGFDRPAVQGHDEAAWSKNRRDEFILLTPPNK